MSATRVPLNFFGIGFGLAGLGEAWGFAAGQGLAPRWAGDAILALSAVAWLAGISLYLRYAATTRGAFAADLRDNVAGPFASLAVITPMLLAAAGVAPHAATAGRVLVDIFLVLTILLGGWFTGHWIYGSLNLDRLHPGYFLPTVAGGLVASDSAATVGQRLLAEMMLGLGLVCSLIHPRLDDPGPAVLPPGAPSRARPDNGDRSRPRRRSEHRLLRAQARAHRHFRSGTGRLRTADDPRSAAAAADLPAATFRAQHLGLHVFLGGSGVDRAALDRRHAPRRSPRLQLPGPSTAAALRSLTCVGRRAGWCRA